MAGRLYTSNDVAADGASEVHYVRARETAGKRVRSFSLEVGVGTITVNESNLLQGLVPTTASLLGKIDNGDGKTGGDDVAAGIRVTTALAWEFARGEGPLLNQDAYVRYTTVDATTRVTLLVEVEE